MVRWCLVNFQCRGVLLISKRVGQGPTVLVVGVGGGGLDIFFSHLSFLSLLSPSLWETARYRLKKSKTSVARTLMSRLPRLLRTRS